MLEILLKHFVDVNTVNAQGNTPICSAVRRLDKKTVKYLLKQKIQPVTLNATQKNLLRIPPLQALELGPGLGKIANVNIVIYVNNCVNRKIDSARSRDD